MSTVRQLPSTAEARGPVGRGCADGSVASVASRLESIVRAYIARFRPRADEELQSFRDEPTVTSAIRRAGLAVTTDGKRYHHQRRLQGERLKDAARQLARANLGRATDFDDLHGRIERAIGFDGIGRLTVYDTALRIGAKLGLEPKKVYLHAGTREGAKALGLNWRAPFIEVGELPRPLRTLAPHEIEDCLCIFKGRFGGAR